MLPKVLCFFAFAALVAAAPYSEDRQYIDQLQKEYQDDKYDDMQTDEYGKIEDMQQQFQDEDEQNSELKDIEQFESEEDQQEESTEQSEDTSEEIGQVEYGTENDKDFEQVQHATEDETQEIEEVDQETENKPTKIEQFEEEDDWNQIDNNNENGGDDIIHFKEDPDDLEADSAIGKLFGDNTVQEQEGTYGDEQDQQQAEVEEEHNFKEEQLPIEEVVPSPSYKSNYGSEYSGVYHPSESFEPEVYTPKTPWYKRLWGKTKETAKGIAHKVKETFRGK